jgi:proline iminopeptidase
VRAYHRKLTCDDSAVRREAALAWNRFENHASKLVAVEEPVAEEDVPKEIALARIEAHYFLNGSFLKSDDQLLRDAERLRRIPGAIVQGKYDLVCPLQSAWDLHLAWPEAQYVVVPDAGHSADEPGIASALVAATEDFKRKI